MLTPTMRWPTESFLYPTSGVPSFHDATTVVPPRAATPPQKPLEVSEVRPSVRSCDDTVPSEPSR